MLPVSTVPVMFVLRTCTPFHSIVCDPWGKVLVDAGENESVTLVDIDLSENERVRQQLPLLSARRPQLYGMKE